MTDATWTHVSHLPLYDALEQYARETGDDELYGYTYSPNGTEIRVQFRSYTALGYSDAIKHVREQILAKRLEAKNA